MRGNIRYETKGIIFTSEDYYFQWIKIRYYPDTPGFGYTLTYRQTYDGFFSSGKRKVNQFIDDQIAYENVLFDITRHAHYQGGGSNEVWCRLAILKNETC